MVGSTTTPTSINNISIVVAGPQVVTMTTSCCFRYKEVNGVIILRHLPNIITAQLSSSFFQAAIRLVVLKASTISLWAEQRINITRE